MNTLDRLGRACFAGLQSVFKAETGAVAVYVAVAIPLFVGGAGLAVDTTSWYRAKRNIQSGADAAAYAAALNLARQGLSHGIDLVALQAAADDAAGRNGMSDPVTVRTPPLSGIAAGDSQSVEVIVTEPAPLYFAAMFLDAAPQITARAVAKAVVADACVWALHPTAMGALTVSGTADVNLDCGVVVKSNDPAAALNQTGSSCLSATSISVGGNYSGDCVSPAPEVSVPDYGDPMSSLAAPAVGGCTYPTLQIIDSGGGGHGHGGGGGTPISVSPGVYCGGLDIRTDVVLQPGLYIINGGYFRIAGTATVTNTEDTSGGVSFYLTGSGSNYATVTIQGGANVTLTPMTTGPLANVLFFQDPNAPASGSNLIAGGSTMQLTGILYFPSQHIDFTGGSSVAESEILLLASTITFTGTSYLDADYANSVLPQEQYARLVE
jgi:Putative Flp pilus-assembly TadE/G-like